MVEGTIGILLRFSALLSGGFLCAAFLASAAQFSRREALLPFACWRRPFLVLLAASHSAHLAFIFTLWRRQGLPPGPLLLLVVAVGGAAYVFIYLAALDALGARFPERLVNGGLYYVWAIFFIAVSSRAPRSVFHAAAAAVLLAALFLRLRTGRRSAAAAAGAP